MATQLPTVRNHLIREITHAILQNGKGDALVFLALSRKDGLSVFKNLINNHVVADVQRKNRITETEKKLLTLYYENTRKDDSDSIASQIPIAFTKPNLENLVIRYIRKLILTLDKYNATEDFQDLLDGNNTLNFQEALTELFITGGAFHSIRLKPFLNLYSEIEVLKINYSNSNFLEEVRCGNIQLKNLRSLELSVLAEEVEHLFTMNPKFPLPEEVTLDCFFMESTDEFTTEHKFPQVKRFTFHGWLDSDYFNTFRTAIQCFPCAEVVVMNLKDYKRWSRGNHMKVVECHDWIQEAGFAIPIDVKYCTTLEFDNKRISNAVFEGLKSIGFKEERTPNDLIIEKQYPNVKLLHRVHRKEVNYGYDDDYYEEMLQRNEAMGYEHLYYGL